MRWHWASAAMAVSAAILMTNLQAGFAQAPGSASSASVPNSTQDASARGAQSIPIDPVTKSPIAGAAPILPKPQYPTSEREVNKFTVEFVYNFARYRYTPAVNVEPVKRGTATYTTPEEAVTSFISSMVAQDYDWWMSNWDAESRKRLDADNQAHHHDATFWRNTWQRALVGKRITITQRLESGPYVLMVYRVDDPANPQASFASALPFKLLHNQWVATEELAADNFSIYALDGRSTVSENRVLGPMRTYDPAVFDSAKAQAEFLSEYPKGKESVTTVVR